MIREIVEIDEAKCDGCGQCIPSCAEGALYLEGGKVRLKADAPPRLIIHGDYIIGLPGETLEVRQGDVYINGELLPEPFGPNPGNYTAPPLKVGPDEIYVMGDNRNNSLDSRMIGPVDISAVVGRADVVVLPMNRIHLLSLATQR